MLPFHSAVNQPWRPRPTHFSNLSNVPRPHTADARTETPAFRQQYIAEEDEDDEEVSDSDITPRASAASTAAVGSERWVPREDTAADVHTLLMTGSSESSRAVGLSISQLDNAMKGPGSHRSSCQRVSSLQSNSSSDTSRRSEWDDSRNSVSSSRRGSRAFKQRFTEIARQATSRSRLRRSSQSRAASSTFGDDNREQVMRASVTPTSPNKRSPASSRFLEDHRPVQKPRLSPLPDRLFSNTVPVASPSDLRKDTPAPPSTLPVRPARTRQIHPSPGGGYCARKAAASFSSQYPMQPQVSQGRADDYSSEDEFQQPVRLGSMTSAADSGADLSTYSGSEHSLRDNDGDMIMEECLPAAVHPTRDFVRQGMLPFELSLQIFESLNAEDLLNAELVNKAWREIASKTSVWRTVFLRKYGRRIHTNPAPIQVGGLGIGRSDIRPNQEWRKMYKARVQLDRNWRRGEADAGKAVYLAGHSDSVYCLQFDEEKIITGSRDRTIRVWDINTYQCMKVIGGPAVKPTLGPKVLRTVDYPSFHMATASVNGTAFGDQIYHVPNEWHDASILCLQYDSEILVTGSSDSDLLVWDIKTYQPIKRLRKHTGGVLDVALDAKHIVSCSKDSRIIVWNRETLEPIGDLTGHRGPVNAVQLRGHLLVSASGDGVARLWDLNQMKLIKEFTPKERGLAAVEFSEDLKYVLAGGNDNITYKFDTETGAEVKRFIGHTQLVRSLWLDSANSRVVSGSYDLDLRVYDFESGDLLWRGEEWTTSWMLAAKSDYRRIVATSQDGRILIVDFGMYKATPGYHSKDGQPIENIDLLRGPDHTTAVQWRNPWSNGEQIY